MLWHLSPEKTLGLGTQLLPGSIWGFLEDNLQNVTQKADFVRKKQGALPEFSINVRRRSCGSINLGVRKGRAAVKP